MPGWARALYTVVLIVASVLLAVGRRESILGATPTSVDLLLVAVAVVCVFLPLVREISLGGLSLKKELQETKKEISDKLNLFKADIVNSIAVSPTINFGAPPLNDEALSRIEAQLKAVVDTAQRDRGAGETPEAVSVSVDDDTSYLFSVRYNIEKELRRIWGNRDFRDSRWPTTVHYMARNLSEAEAIPSEFVRAIKEVYNVCSPAIHGEEVSEQQVAFVRDLAPGILATLRDVD